VKESGDSRVCLVTEEAYQYRESGDGRCEHSRQKIVTKESGAAVYVSIAGRKAYARSAGESNNEHNRAEEHGVNGGSSICSKQTEEAGV
jgi:hypothetical protein